jgi:lipoprotein-releasing system permease protein
MMPLMKNLTLQPHVISRYLTARRGFVKVVTGFSLLGIFLGVAALIVVMSVMAGFREELLNRILGMTGHINVNVQNMTIAEGKAARADLMADEGMTSVQMYTQAQGMVVRGGNASGILVRGIDPSFVRGQELLFDSIVAGDLHHLAKPNTVSIGDSLAKKLGVGVGDSVTLMSPRGTPTIAGFVPRMQRMEVAAIFDVGFTLYNNGWMLMSLETVGKFFGVGNKIGGFEIRVTTPDELLPFDEKIRAVTGENVFISGWNTVNKQFFEALQVEKVVMFIILSLVIVVAAFNIITGQTMLVGSKRGDIAILRTMGAPRRKILGIFFWNGLLLGGVGTLAGIGAGLLISFNLQSIVAFLESVTGVSIFSGEAYYLTEIPVVILLADIIRVSIMSMALTVLACLYPAWRAAKTDPVEVLRSL